ncbi:putative leader peptide [Embleya sp. NPDC001921]
MFVPVNGHTILFRRAHVDLLRYAGCLCRAYR